MTRRKLFDSAVSTIVLTALLAGTLDALAAILVYDVKPMNMFRYIASGAFGAKAMVGGLGMALWGVFFHYLIASTWTLIYFLLYPRIKAVSDNKFVNGALYGLIIWCVMNLVVLPLSSISRAPIALKPAAIGAVILIFAVGLPVSLLMSRYFERQP